MGDRMAWVERRRAEIRTRALVPRDNPPNDNPTNDGGEGGVGPNDSEGYGNTHVMYPQSIPPPQVQAWSGWPVEWSTPMWGSTVGLDAITQRTSTVWTCMDLNASALAGMPPYGVDGRQALPPVEWMRNPQPGVYASYEEAMHQLVMSFQSGEAILWATDRYIDGRVATWVLLDPGQVFVEWDYDRARYTYAVNGTDITADVCHIRYASWPKSPRGVGPLAAAARNMSSASVLEWYAEGLARRGGIPWAVLKYTGGELSAGKSRELQDQWVSARQSAQGAPAVLSGYLELETLTLNPKDMALLELRQFDESRLAVVLGVPPFLAGLPSGGDSLTYQSAAMLFDYHWRAGLRPKMARISGAISNWAYTSPTARFEVDRDDYTRPPFDMLAQAYSVLHGIQDNDGKRALSVDEIREQQRWLGPAKVDPVRQEVPA